MQPPFEKHDLRIDLYARLTTDPVREAVEKATQEMAGHWTDKDVLNENTEETGK